jgi:hypothetical protein
VRALQSMSCACLCKLLLREHSKRPAILAACVCASSASLLSLLAPMTRGGPWGQDAGEIWPVPPHQLTIMKAGGHPSSQHFAEDEVAQHFAKDEVAMRIAYPSGGTFSFVSDKSRSFPSLHMLSSSFHHQRQFCPWAQGSLENILTRL